MPEPHSLSLPAERNPLRSGRHSNAAIVVVNEREALEERRIDHRENCTIGPDADRQHGHRDVLAGMPRGQHKVLISWWMPKATSLLQTP